MKQSFNLFHQLQGEELINKVTSAFSYILPVLKFILLFFFLTLVSFWFYSLYSIQ